MEQPPRAHVMLCVNDLWNVANFRLRLVEAIEAEGHSVTVVGPPDLPLEARLRTPSRRLVTVRMRKQGLSPWEEGALLVSLVRVIRHERPDVLLTFTPKPNIYGALAASMLRTPAVPNVSGLGTAFIRGGVLRHVVSILYALAFRRVPRVFFQNEEDRELFIRSRLVREEQATVLPGSGVDLGYFRPLPPRDLDATTCFLFVGRLLGDKGIRELVEASRQLRAKHSGIRVQLLGFIDADNRTAVTRAELDSWIAEGVVEYLGTTEDVRPHLARADAIVLPSYREGLPRSLLEAAAMGKPAIATDVPGNRCVVEDGVNGFLCEARNAASLGAAMERFLLLSTRDRDVLGQRAREKVVEGFSEAKVIQAYKDTIRRLIKTGADA